MIFRSFLTHSIHYRLAIVSLILCLSFYLSSVSHAEERDYSLKTIASGFKDPWTMVFLPNRDILVSQRNGQLKVITDGKIGSKTVSGVPDVYFAGQGGLLDILLDKDFAKNQTIYLSFAHGKRRSNATRLVSAKLSATETHYKLENVTVLFTASPTKSTAHHHGGRIAQLDDGTLLMTVGDGYNYREQAQTLDNHFGKIIRVNTDGSTPDDNPYVGVKGALSEIYTHGHRNQQALLTYKGVIYEHEHGPKGGDEVNKIAAGTNYGWPVATFGIDYSGARISPFTEYEGMRSPDVNWTPSIAPSGMTVHDGALYVTSLAEGSIRKLDISGDNLIDRGIVYSKLNERLRDIVSAPDGSLYVLTDGGNAKLIKIVEN